MFCILLMLMISSVAYAQQDSVMCLTKSEILILANKIQLIQDSSAYKTSIITSQSRLIDSYNQRVGLYEQQLKNRQESIELVNKQNDQLKKQVEELRPKWYDDNRLWFGAGVVTTVIVFVVTR
jgi:hypothetical protein